MAKRTPRVILFYLLAPAVLVLFVTSFMYAKYSNVSQPSYHLQQSSNSDVAAFMEYALPVVTPLALNQSISMGIIDTLREYSKLNLNPLDTNFWSSKLESQYQKTLNESNFSLKVIIVPHSHNDPGWLNTYDQYFYHYTYYILDNMVKYLTKYPNMTFIWPEMSYFSRWWDRTHSESTKRKLKKLINEGRFEIVTGGWVMTDEGPTHYYDMLDQLIEGHQFLRTTLQHQPSSSWSIDPFGHSATFPYLLQKSGITKMYIQRTHFAWKQHLSETRSLEFVWRQYFHNLTDTDKGQQQQLCHMSPLALYSFKYACGPDFKTCLEFDFRKIFGESSESTAEPLNEVNIERKARRILEQYSKLGSLFAHNVALVLLGDDFRYNFDIEWQQQYGNYTMLIDYINSNGAKFNNAHIEFGTLKNYFDAVQERMPLQNNNNYPSLYGDFMPYADVYVDNVPSYWTGYFITRPYYKQLSRELQRWLRSVEILYTLVKSHLQVHSHSSLVFMLNKDYSTIVSARQNLALFQHHDGITGTSRDYVMEDYGRRMGHSITNLMDLAAMCVQLLNSNRADSENVTKQFVYSHLQKPNWEKQTERSILHIPADQNGLKLLLFNTHLQHRVEPIRVLIDDPFVKLFDIEERNEVLFQINPVFTKHGISSSVFELEFIAPLEPLSLRNYKIVTSSENINSKVSVAEWNNTHDANQDQVIHTNEAFRFESLSELSIENQIMKLNFDSNGQMVDILMKRQNSVVPMELSFTTYNSEPYESGAYLFKPNLNNSAHSLNTTAQNVKLFKGKLSSTLTANYTDLEYSVKLYNSSAPIGSMIELKVRLDLENKDLFNDQEVVLRIKVPINNKAINNDGRLQRIFYVDSNGFQMLKRRYIDEVGVEGNYYPMTTAMYIEDFQWRLNILSSCSHGVSSPSDGMVEIMLDRRILADDKRGLSQGITDNLFVELTFGIVLESLESQFLEGTPNQPLTWLSDSLSLQLNYPPVVTYSYKGDSEVVNHQNKNYFFNRQLISPGLLCNYFLLNLRTLPITGNFGKASHSSLLILHNRVFSGQQQNVNQCKLDTNQLTKQGMHLFNDLKLTSIQACTLTGLQPLKQLHSLSQLVVSPHELAAFNLTFG